MLIFFIEYQSKLFIEDAHFYRPDIITATNCNDVKNNDSYIAISSSLSSSILIYTNVNNNIRKLQSLLLPTVDDSKRALLCRGLTFSNDNRYLYALAVINTNNNANNNTNTSAYMNYSSYIVIYDVNDHIKAIDNIKTNTNTNTTNTNTNTDTYTINANTINANTNTINANTTNSSTENNNNGLISMINKMMLSIDSRLTNIESILRYIHYYYNHNYNETNKIFLLVNMMINLIAYLVVLMQLIKSSRKCHPCHRF